MDEIDNQFILWYNEINEYVKNIFEYKMEEEVTLNYLMEVRSSPEIETINNKYPSVSITSWPDRMKKLMQIAVLDSNPLNMTDEEFEMEFGISRDRLRNIFDNLDINEHLEFIPITDILPGSGSMTYKDALNLLR